MNSDVDYALVLRAIRRVQRLTQEQLARELEVTYGTVNGWENGKHLPIPALASRIIALARKSGVSAVVPRKSSARRSTSRRSSK